MKKIIIVAMLLSLATLASCAEKTTEAVKGATDTVVETATEATDTVVETATEEVK